MDFIDWMHETRRMGERPLKAALAAASEPEQREWLAARCLVAPVECCGDPRSYVLATNELVAARVRGATPSE